MQFGLISISDSKSRNESKRKKITDVQVFKIHAVLNENENWTLQTEIFKLYAKTVMSNSIKSSGFFLCQSPLDEILAFFFPSPYQTFFKMSVLFF